MLFAILQEACAFSKILQLYNPAEVISCLETIPLEADMFERTQSFIEMYTELYVHAPRFAGTDRDMHASLARLRAQFEGNASATFYDYYNAIHAFVYSYSDAHLMYQKPSFFGLINQVSPFALAKANSGYVFKVTPQTSQVFYLYCKNVENISTFENQPIKTINGLPVAEFLQKYAAEHYSRHSDAGARVNSALELDFALTQTLVSPLYTDYQFAVELESGAQFVLQRLVALNAPIASDAALRSLYDACLKQNPYVEPEASNQRYMSPNLAPEPLFSGISAAFAESDSEFELVNYVNNFYAIYAAKSTTDFVLQIVSFSPSDYEKSVDTLRDGLEMLRTRKSATSRLFISLVMNGGGNPTLAALLANVLAPSRLMLPKTTMRDSQLWRFMGRVKSLLFYFKFFDQITNTTYSNYLAQEALNESPLDHLDIARQKMDGQSYSQYFNFDLQASEANDRLQAFGTLDFDPSSVIVITDGTCLSAAGYFAQALKQRNAAVFVGVGEPTGQFCGVSGGVYFGNVVYEYAVENILAIPDMKSAYTLEELERMMEYYLPHNGMLGVTVFASHGYLFEQDDRGPLDFVSDKVDVQFENIQLLYPNCLGTSFLSELTPVFQASYSGITFGKVCKQDKGVVYRTRGGECTKFGCEPDRLYYNYGQDFVCLGSEPIAQKSNTGYIVAVSVLAVATAALGAVVIALFLKGKLSAKSSVLAINYYTK